MPELTSRERMLRTLGLQATDRIPCCFMSFTALRQRHHDDLYELAKAERAMGLDAMKQKVDGRMCLWGGVSAAATVERGEEQDVRAAVRQAMSTLGPRGLILAPIDNLTVDAPRTWRNIETLIDAWKNAR